jgi:hypothetical protein
MIDIDFVISLLQTNTAYTVELAKAKEPNLQELSELPIIYVGYLSIDSKNPSAPIEHDLYNLHGEDLVQSFSIQIVCEALDLPVIWREVYAALIGKTPTSTWTSAEATSGLTYAQGGVMGIVNAKVWHVDVWKIGFPTINVEF